MYNLKREIRSLIAALQERLAPLSTTVESLDTAIRKHIEATEQKWNRDDERQNSPTRVVAEIQFPKAEETKYTANQEQQSRIQQIIAIATWGTFIGAILYAAIALVQVREMRAQTSAIIRQQEIENAGASHRAFEVDRQLRIAERQVNASKRQAEAAQASAFAISRQMRVQQRPWIAVSMGDENTPDTGFAQVSMVSKVGEELKYPLRVRNIGITPAIDVMISSAMIVVAKGEEPFLPDVPHYKNRNFHKGVSGKTAMASTGVGFIFPARPAVVRFPKLTIQADGKSVTSTGFSVEEANSLSNGNAYTVVVGQVLYRDMFRKEHWTNFCIAYFANGAPASSNKCSDFSAVDSN